MPREFVGGAEEGEGGGEREESRAAESERGGEVGDADRGDI